MKRTVLIALYFCIYGSVLAQKPDSEEAFREYFTAQGNNLNPIEGIWMVSTIQEFYRYDTLYNVNKYPRAAQVAIIHTGEFYSTFNMAGDPYDVSFYNTDVKGVYLYKNYFRSTQEYSNTQAVISKAGEMQYTYEFPEIYLYLQFGDSFEEGTRVVNLVSWKKLFPEE